MFVALLRAIYLFKTNLLREKSDYVNLYAYISDSLSKNLHDVNSSEDILIGCRTMVHTNRERSVANTFSGFLLKASIIQTIP